MSKNKWKPFFICFQFHATYKNLRVCKNINLIYSQKTKKETAVLFQKYQGARSAEHHEFMLIGRPTPPIIFTVGDRRSSGRERTVHVSLDGMCTSLEGVI